MENFQKIIAWMLCIVLLTHMTAPVFAAQQQSSSKKNAADLVKNADRAVAYVVKTARTSGDPALSPDKEDAKPFWQAVKKLNEALEKVDRGLFLQDDTFFTSLAVATSAVEEVKVTYGMSGAKETAVKEGIEKADAAVSLLREHYSKESARLKQGGALSEEEQQKLDEIKNKQSELQNKLTELEGKAGKNETLLKGIRDTQEQSRAVSSCNNDVAGFVFAMTAINIITGLITGWHWWWGPWGVWWPDFSLGFVDIYVDVVHVIDYDWVIVDDYIDLESYALDLEVALDEADLELTDAYLDAADFEIELEDSVEFAADELELEGAMDIIELEEFSDIHAGDFSSGDLDF